MPVWYLPAVLYFSAVLPDGMGWDSALDLGVTPRDSAPQITAWPVATHVAKYLARGKNKTHLGQVKKTESIWGTRLRVQAHTQETRAVTAPNNRR